MSSFTSRQFRRLYGELPEEIKSRAERAYRLFGHNPAHPGLNFKQVDEQEAVYSARVGLGYRALGQIDGNDIIWFWIGPHAEYDKLLRRR